MNVETTAKFGDFRAQIVYEILCNYGAPALPGVIAWLEGRAANTDTDPRWLAAIELRRIR